MGSSPTTPSVEKIMKNLIIKNKKFRVSFKNSELKSYMNISNSAGLTKIRNICVLTGRARATNLEYKISRLKFKKLAEFGKIPGWTKI